MSFADLISEFSADYESDVDAETFPDWSPPEIPRLRSLDGPIIGEKV
jgi:hypothetical protein